MARSRESAAARWQESGGQVGSHVRSISLTPAVCWALETGLARISQPQNKAGDVIFGGLSTGVLSLGID